VPKREFLSNIKRLVDLETASQKLYGDAFNSALKRIYGPPWS